LPFFAHTQEEAGDVVPGTPESAPYKINLLKLFCVNTVVSVVAFAGLYAVIANI
jgi:predicted secreted protein